MQDKELVDNALGTILCTMAIGAGFYFVWNYWKGFSQAEQSLFYCGFGFLAIIGLREGMLAGQKIHGRIAAYGARTIYLRAWHALSLLGEKLAVALSFSQKAGGADVSAQKTMEVIRTLSPTPNTGLVQFRNMAKTNRRHGVSAPYAHKDTRSAA
jgi:hypothetical protein